MANINESIQQLTDSLQELTARRNANAYAAQNIPQQLAAGELSFSKDVETFLEATRAYSAKTSHVSVGSY